MNAVSEVPIYYRLPLHCCLTQLNFTNNFLQKQFPKWHPTFTTTFPGTTTPSYLAPFWRNGTPFLGAAASITDLFRDGRSQLFLPLLPLGLSRLHFERTSTFPRNDLASAVYLFIKAGSRQSSLIPGQICLLPKKGVFLPEGDCARK